MTADTQDYGPDFVPTPAQAARADQQLARARDALDAVVAKVAAGGLEPGRPQVVAIGLIVGDALVEMINTEEEAFPAAMALAATAVCRLLDAEAEVARLGSQLAEAQKRIGEECAEHTKTVEEAQDLLAQRDEARFHLGQERHARKLNELGLLAKLRDAEAERDSLAARLADAEKVVEAAKAWRAWHGTRHQVVVNGVWQDALDSHEHALAVAVDQSTRAGETAPVVAAPLISAPNPVSPQTGGTNSPVELRAGRRGLYTIPGLEGTWRLMGLATTNMGEDGRAILHAHRIETPLVAGDQVLVDQPKEGP